MVSVGFSELVSRPRPSSPMRMALEQSADVLFWPGHNCSDPAWSLRVRRNSLDRRRVSQSLGLSTKQMWFK